jgi:hypothetical protein
MDENRRSYSGACMALPFARPRFGCEWLRKPGWVLLCKLEGRPDRLATATRSRRVCAGRPTEVCIRLTTPKGHDGQARPAAGPHVVRQSSGHDRALTTRIEPAGNQCGARRHASRIVRAGYSAKRAELQTARRFILPSGAPDLLPAKGQPWLPGPDKPRCARAVPLNGGGPKTQKIARRRGLTEKSTAPSASGTGPLPTEAGRLKGACRRARRVRWPSIDGG